MNEMFGLPIEILRLAIFVLVFVSFAILETFFPFRKKLVSRTQRWLTSFSLVFLSTAMLRFVPGMGAAVVAITAEQKGWGLLHYIEIPFYLSIILAVVALDFLIYVQHRLFHAIPLLWRLHKVHHVDRDFDVSTGIRFHPIEIFLSMAYKSVCVLVLGLPAVAVILFDVLLNASALFTHSNIHLPAKLDKILRILFVTPDMHRVHHSVVVEETNSNYGFFLSMWDKICATYIFREKTGDDDLHIGLNEYQTEEPVKFWWSLLLPFKEKD